MPPSLLERFVLAFPLPYVVSCAILAGLMGSLGFVIARTIDTANFDLALRDVQATLVRIVGTDEPWRTAIYSVLSLAYNFFLLHMARWMRLRIVAAEAAIAPLLPEGAQSYRRIMRVLSKPWPPILIGVAIGAFVLPSSTGQLPYSAGPVQVIAIVLATVLSYWAIGTGLWTYFASLWTLHRLGQEPVRLRSCHEDSMLGLRPLGSLSLALSTVYFSAVALVSLQTIMVKDPRPLLLGLLTALAVLGIAMFYLPLKHSHDLMVERKSAELSRVRARFQRVLETSEAPNPGDREATLEDVKRLLGEMRDILAFDGAERRVAALPTWPFNPSVLGRLTAIATSIVLAIVTKVLMDFLFPKA